ncbi:hypothetical protein [Sulfurovum sp.]|uniref:hypothetical protein n=1 Tax=Sulfurovum sp. TaxID=1969726 RepID=UPI0025E775C3|nr:hypothetical protein [Sulfurovum sp.]
MNKYILSGCIICTVSLLNGCDSNPAGADKKTSVENPVNTYMDSRVNALENAKAAVAKSNAQTKKQDNAIKALIKQ